MATNTHARVYLTEKNALLATQALRYLDSLTKPLPEESDTAFYEQNARDYKALLHLNRKGIGATRRELQSVAKASLTQAEIKLIVERIRKIDSLVSAEYRKEEIIDKTPKYWDGFFSGYESTPTARGAQLLANINKRIDKLSREQAELFKKITMAQAIEHGYLVDGMDPLDFKPVLQA